MKTILLHIHGDAEQGGRVTAALALARATGGHVRCVQVAPVEPFGAEPYGGLFGMAAIIDTIHDEDKRVRTLVEPRLRAAGISYSWACYDGGVVETLIAEARLADVVILSQPVVQRSPADRPLAIVGDVAIHARAPVLLVPAGSGDLNIGGDVMLAWNGGAEAAHALRLARPLLARAARVHVVEVSDEQLGLPAGDAVAYLTRAGIAAEAHDWPAKGRRISVALRHAAEELAAGYLLMGAYGHSRLRETVLGGVTRELIQTTSIPLLMAH